MKKLFLLLFTTVCSLGAFAQTGDLSVGATGGYITKYKGLMYGFNVGYHVTDPLEFNFSGLMNPNMTEKIIYSSIDITSREIKMYSTNLDIRYYMMLQREWATGPFIGGQYSYLDRKDSDSDENIQYKHNIAGFNVGWHLRINLTDNLKINGGWRYTMANQNASHHVLYLGLGYTFNMF